MWRSLRVKEPTVPVFIKVASAVLVMEAMVLLFLVSSVSPLTTVGLLGLTLLLAWLLWRGSRLAWLLLVAGSGSLLVGPFLFGQPVWTAGSGAIVLGCLLMPSSRQFVSSKVPFQQFVINSETAVELGVRIETISRQLASPPEKVRSFVKRTLFVVGFGVLFATPFVSKLGKYHQGSGRDSTIVNVAWGVVSITYLLARVAFLVLVGYVIYVFVTSRRARVSTSIDQRKP